MKSATLGQAQKILSLMEGISSDKIQEVIESGLLARVLRDGSLEELPNEELTIRWETIQAVNGFDEICITVPHMPYPSILNQTGAFQLRCWKGPHGFAQEGHIDRATAKGTLLFETTLPNKLNTSQYELERQLSEVGLKRPGGLVWHLETKNGDEFRGARNLNFDYLTLSKA